MKIYTKNGDKGNTKLLYGGSVSKDNFEPEAVGTVDELVASLGIIRAEKDLIAYGIHSYLLARAQVAIRDPVRLPTPKKVVLKD